MEKVIKKNDDMKVTFDISEAECYATLELIEHYSNVPGRKQKNIRHRLRLDIELPAESGVIGIYGALSSSNLCISCRSEDDDDIDDEKDWDEERNPQLYANKKAPKAQAGPDVGDWISFIYTQGGQGHELVISMVRYIDENEPAYLITDKGSVHINKVLEIRKVER